MRIHQQIWKYFQQHRETNLIGKGSVVLALSMVFFGTILSMNIMNTSAHSFCSNGDQPYKVVRGDTLSAIATRFGTNWYKLASHNALANPSLIYRNQTLCVPGKGSGNGSSGNLLDGAFRVVGASHNVFPFGTCTWWADHRYFQLHGIYVPWKMGANAWQWTMRAYQFHWRVSRRPVPGAIVDLQPWVEGAYGAGHVAIVEKILRNGHVIASNMSWGANPWRVTLVEFAPGPGVTFIIQ